jgi:hypothetical protein
MFGIKGKTRTVDFGGSPILRSCSDVLRNLPRLTPKIGGHNERVDLVFGPPGPFIATLMQIAMVHSADRDGKLIADFSSHRTLLGKFDMVGIGRDSAADETRLRGDKS